MTTITEPKKRKLRGPTRFPGIGIAATELGVSRWHLFCVLTGLRESKPLLARYRALNPKTNAAMNKSTPVKREIPVELAAAENLSPFFFNTLATLGLEVVILSLTCGPQSKASAHPGIELEIERILQAGEAGCFDATFYVPGFNYFFFHVPAGRLGHAMMQIKSALAAHGLLDCAAILHAETASELREWYPGTTAALIDTSLETEA